MLHMTTNLDGFQSESRKGKLNTVYEYNDGNIKMESKWKYGAMAKTGFSCNALRSNSTSSRAWHSTTVPCRRKIFNFLQVLGAIDLIHTCHP
jgi:hypothetical protein